MPARPPSRRLLTFVVVALVVMVGGWLVSKGADLPDDPSLAVSASTTSTPPPISATASPATRPIASRAAIWTPAAKPRRSLVKPFSAVSFRVSKPVACVGAGCTRPARAKRSGALAKVLEWCALLADTEPERQVGLMQQKDLSGFDGMIFSFPSDAFEPFYMFQTLVPLSIAWFDSSGALVSTTDMEPCTDSNPRNCPLYAAERPYRYALEVPKGALPVLGVGAGASLQVGGACRAV